MNSPFLNGKENRQANKLRRQERKGRAKEIKDSGVGADKYSFTGHESDMGKYDKKGRHKEFPEQRYSKKNPASNKAASDMMRTNYLSPVNNGKKKSTFGGTPDFIYSCINTVSLQPIAFSAMSFTSYLPVSDIMKVGFSSLNVINSPVKPIFPL